MRIRQLNMHFGLGTSSTWYPEYYGSNESQNVAMRGFKPRLKDRRRSAARLLDDLEGR